jgi:GAF domain-containing protein
MCATLDNQPNGSGSEVAALVQAACLLEQAQRALLRASADDAGRAESLAERIRSLETSLEEMEQLLISTERQAAQLANLYVATYQLHASLDPDEVCAAIADIAVNLLGAEAFSILATDADGKLAVAPEYGSAEGPYLSPIGYYQEGDVLVDACLEARSSGFGPIQGSQALAVVPLVSEGQLLGVLVIDTFLRHKPGLSSEDRELLDVMAAHAASALLAARSFQASQRKLQTYQGLLGLLRRPT